MESLTLGGTLGTIHSLAGEKEHCEGAAATDGQTTDTSLGCGQLLDHDDELQSPGFQVTAVW